MDRFEDFKPGSHIYNMFHDFWNMNKKYINRNVQHSMRESDWYLMLEELNLFIGKYDREPYVKDLALALISEIERRYKAAKEREM